MQKSKQNIKTKQKWCNLHTIDVQLNGGFAIDSTVKITVTSVFARILHAGTCDFQCWGALVYFYHLFLILNFCAILVPCYISITPSLNTRGEEKCGWPVSAFFFLSFLKSNQINSPLHSSKLSSPTGIFCLLTTICIFASGEREERVCLWPFSFSYNTTASMYSASHTVNVAINTNHFIARTLLNHQSLTEQYVLFSSAWMDSKSAEPEKDHRTGVFPLILQWLCTVSHNNNHNNNNYYYYIRD